MMMMAMMMIATDVCILGDGFIPHVNIVKCLYIYIYIYMYNLYIYIYYVNIVLV